MQIEELLFYFFAAITIGFALFMSITRNIVYASFSFLCVLLGVAVIFIYAGAEFAAVTQLLIYVGGVLVLILFGVMLTADYASTKRAPIRFSSLVGSILCLMFLIGLLYSFQFIDMENAIYHQTGIMSNVTTELTMSREIGFHLITDYVLPFEMSGILLFISLIGASLIASHKKSPQA